MRPGSKTWSALAAASVLVAAALTFAAVELPRVVSAAILEQIDFPDFDHSYHAREYGAFVDSWHLRPLGYGALLAVVILIALGLVRERRGAAVTGAVAFFLPLFGHFARSMFFLAGLGLLRAAWLPILDISPDLLRLGDAVSLPYAGMTWLAAVAGVDVRGWLSWLVMGGGMLLFVLGTLTWFRCRMEGDDLAEVGVYRLCRHPQYLGWIVWSYGLLLYLVRNYEGQHFKLGWALPSSLPWLVSALVIVGVAWIEELAMERSYEERYAAYRSRVPFLLPLPRPLARVLAVIVFYLVVLVGLSLPFLIHQRPPRGGWWAFPYTVYAFR